MELTRGDGPGERPPIDPEQQRQLELQQQLEREQLREQQQPQVMTALDKHLEEHPALSRQLSGYSTTQQNDIKHTLADEITQRLGSNGLNRIDFVLPAKDGGIIVHFNEFRMVYLKGDQMPLRSPDTANRHTPQEPPIQPEQQSESITRQSSLAPANREQETPAVARPSPEIPAPPEPARDPAERQAAIRQQLDTRLGDTLNLYPADQQTTLKQALMTEISDIGGNRLHIGQIEQQEDGRLTVELNRGLNRVTIDPQDILKPEIPREPPVLSLEEQQRQDTQRQIQQQLAQLGQHTPLDQMIIESRLREAV